MLKQNRTLAFLITMGSLNTYLPDSMKRDSMMQRSANNLLHINFIASGTLTDLTLRQGIHFKNLCSDCVWTILQTSILLELIKWNLKHPNLNTVEK